MLTPAMTLVATFARAFGADATRIVDDPVAAFARLRDGLFKAFEALVQREVVSDGVLHGAQ